jgi:hypothetical protein
MKKATPAQPELIQTIQVRSDGKGGFEAVSAGRVLGRSQNERLTIWTSVMAAEEMAKLGSPCRVTALRDGKEVDEFVAAPPYSAS